MRYHPFSWPNLDTPHASQLLSEGGLEALEKKRFAVGPLGHSPPRTATCSGTLRVQVLGMVQERAWRNNLPVPALPWWCSRLEIPETSDLR